MDSAAAAPLEWRIDDTLVGYEDALATMEARVAAIRAGTAPELVWLLQHPSLYTAGSSARPEDLLEPGRLPVYQAGRGGQYTYHGPGQRVAYLMLDLRRRGNDVHRFVHGVESWLIRTLARFGIQGETRSDRVGVWVAGENGREDKIAAIGIRVRHGITFHGASINVDPDLSQFEGIVPCGIQGHGVTSLAAKGVNASMAEVDLALRAEFDSVFG